MLDPPIKLRIEFLALTVLENVITVGMQSRQWDSTVFNGAEEVDN